MNWISTCVSADEQRPKRDILSPQNWLSRCMLSPSMANADLTTETIPPATTSPTTPATTPGERQRTGWVVAVTLAALAVLIIVILYAIDVL